MSKAKNSIDWVQIERDYRKTDLSIRELARWYGLSDKAIRLKAKAGGWVRPGADAPQETPQAPQPVAVFVERVTTPLTAENTKPEAIVGRGRNLVLRMLDELDTTTSHIGEMQEQIEEAASGSSNAARRAAMMKAVDLPARAGTLRALALALKTFAETADAGGKKARAEEEAKAAGLGSEWGDDLAPPAPRPN